MAGEFPSSLQLRWNRRDWFPLINTHTHTWNRRDWFPSDAMHLSNITNAAGDVRECEHNEDGLLEKVKDCLLVLIDDVLLCCAISNR